MNSADAVRIIRSGGFAELVTVLLVVAVSLNACTTEQNTGGSSAAPTTSVAGTLSSGRSTASTSSTAETSNAADIYSSASANPVDREWREALDLGILEDVWARSYNETQRRIRACMKAKGFAYIPVDFVSTTRLLYRSINPLNEASALHYGYHTPPMPSPVDRNDYSLAGFDAALNGPQDSPSQGCGVRAHLPIVKASDTATNDAAALLRSLEDAVLGFDGSRAGLDLMASWSRCMAQSGWRFSSQAEAARRFAGTGKIQPDELKVRSADLLCDKSVGLTKARSSWERSRLDSWLAKNSAAWSALQGELRSAEKALTSLEQDRL